MKIGDSKRNREKNRPPGRGLCISYHLQPFHELGHYQPTAHLVRPFLFSILSSPLQSSPNAHDAILEIHIAPFYPATRSYIEKRGNVKFYEQGNI